MFTVTIRCQDGVRRPLTNWTVLGKELGVRTFTTRAKAQKIADDANRSFMGLAAKVVAMKVTKKAKRK